MKNVVRTKIKDSHAQFTDGKRRFFLRPYLSWRQLLREADAYASVSVKAHELAHDVRRKDAYNRGHHKMSPTAEEIATATVASAS